MSGEKAAFSMREILPHMGARRSQRIADTLGVARFRKDATPLSSVAARA